MNEYSSFTTGGKMAYQCVLTNGKTWQAVQQADGSFWMYFFATGSKKGGPIRGKSRQKQILEFVAEVKAALND
jgi:hypothetical protein